MAHNTFMQRFATPSPPTRTSRHRSPRWPYVVAACAIGGSAAGLKLWQNYAPALARHVAHKPGNNTGFGWSSAQIAHGLQDGFVLLLIFGALCGLMWATEKVSRRLTAAAENFIRTRCAPSVVIGLALAALPVVFRFELLPTLMFMALGVVIAGAALVFRFTEGIDDE